MKKGGKKRPKFFTWVFLASINGVPTHGAGGGPHGVLAVLGKSSQTRLTEGVAAGSQYVGVVEDVETDGTRQNQRDVAMTGARGVVIVQLIQVLV